MASASAGDDAVVATGSVVEASTSDSFVTPTSAATTTTGSSASGSGGGGGGAGGGAGAGTDDGNSSVSSAEAATFVAHANAPDMDDDTIQGLIGTWEK